MIVSKKYFIRLSRWILEPTGTWDIFRWTKYIELVLEIAVINSVNNSQLLLIVSIFENITNSTHTEIITHWYSFELYYFRNNDGNTFLRNTVFHSNTKNNLLVLCKCRCCGFQSLKITWKIIETLNNYLVEELVNWA